jgi:hypothetical protein
MFKKCYLHTLRSTVFFLCMFLFFNKQLLGVSSGKIIIFLSTGRCGTQFFTSYLSQVVDRTKSVVVHEPLGASYSPRTNLRTDNLKGALENYPIVKEHFKRIAHNKNNKHLYIETGWPIFPWIPYLLDTFGKDVLVVHLLRHPIRFAFSWASHGFYNQKRNDNFAKLGSLQPTDPGVMFRAYRSIWSSLNPVERSLFQWLEVNKWAEELKKQYPGQFITLKSEEMLEAPEKLLKHLQAAMPELEEFFTNRPQLTTLVDSVHFKPSNLKLKSLRFISAVKHLADKYGYSMQVDQDTKQRFLVSNVEPKMIFPLKQHRIKKVPCRRLLPV